MQSTWRPLEPIINNYTCPDEFETTPSKSYTFSCPICRTPPVHSECGNVNVNATRLTPWQCQCPAHCPELAAVLSVCFSNLGTCSGEAGSSTCSSTYMLYNYTTTCRAPFHKCNGMPLPPRRSTLSSVRISPVRGVDAAP